MANKHTIKKKLRTGSQCADLLRKDFPELYSNVYCGLSCHPGWFDIAYEMSENIQGVIDVARAAGVEVKFNVAQMKEKFRFLCVHPECDCKHDAIRTALYALVRRAELYSANICDMCGDYGGLVDDNYWLKTRCEKHKKTQWEAWNKKYESKNRKS